MRGLPSAVHLESENKRFGGKVGAAEGSVEARGVVEPSEHKERARGPNRGAAQDMARCGRGCRSSRALQHPGLSLGN